MSTTRFGIAGLAMGFTGIAAPGFTAQQNNDDDLLGVGYVLLAAADITVSNVAIKHLAGTLDPLMAAGAQLLIGMIPLSLIAALTETHGDVTWSPEFVAILLGLALPGTAIFYWVWLSALEALTLNRANAFSFLVPIFGLSMGPAFFGEVLTVSIALGASVVLVSRTGDTDPTPSTESASSPMLDATAA